MGQLLVHGAAGMRLCDATVSKLKEEMSVGL